MNSDENDKTPDATITPSTIECAEQMLGLAFTPEKRTMMTEGVTQNREHYRALRGVPLPNGVAPALRFDPSVVEPASNAPIARDVLPFQQPTALAVPENLEELAFWPVTHLAELLRTRQVRSEALTEMYLDRLERYGPQLECVITLTKERALAQARRADAEMAAGRYRGPLHGIPWGAKDLLAVRGYPTTWGAAPYREQTIDEDAAVVQRLDEAGAVLVGKLTMGALAWGDYWFGGRTRSPWNREEGSSGSSAGSGAATAAGLVGFSIGTETHGSIVSPSTNCGLSGLRPTYGRVSRAGAMALSWSMDKIGPMCRSVGDCTLVFNAIYGPDDGGPGTDTDVVNRPFQWTPDVDLSALRIGYLADDFAQEYPGCDNDRKTLDALRTLGADLIPVTLPDYPIEALSIILAVEAAAAFDELTRSGKDAQLVRQVQKAWPNRFREARLIPAVEYVQANRVRTLVMQAMHELMQTVDLFVAPAKAGDTLLLTNLTGHPAVVIPNGYGGTGEPGNGFSENGLPTSITFIGNLYDEGTPLAVAKQVQDATDFHTRIPLLSDA